MQHCDHGIQGSQGAEGSARCAYFQTPLLVVLTLNGNQVWGIVGAIANCGRHLLVIGP